MTERPLYRILEQPFYGPDDHLHVDGDEIYYNGEPNENMEPLNEPANKALEAFFEKLEAHARKAAEKAGREYTGRPRDLQTAISMAHEDARRTQLSPGDGGVPLMGAKKSTTSSIERVIKDEPPRKEGRRKLVVGTAA